MFIINQIVIARSLHLRQVHVKCLEKKTLQQIKLHIIMQIYVEKMNPYVVLPEHILKITKHNIVYQLPQISLVLFISFIIYLRLYVVYFESIP